MAVFGGGNKKAANSYIAQLDAENAAKAQAAQQAAAQAQAAEAERIRQQQMAQAAADAKVAEEAKVNAAKTAGTGFLGQRLASDGIAQGNGAFNEISSYFNNKLNANPYGDSASYYGDAYSTAEGNARRRYTKTIDDSLPYGYERTKFADTADDGILESILGGQKSTAQEAIERAKSRGQLNDAGYAAANTGLTDYATKGRAKLEDLGLGVLNTYRTNLTNEENNLRQRAGTISLGSNFDVNAGVQGINDLATGYSGRMEGDVRNAVGDQNFFDLNSLLGKAGSAQGFTNPGQVVAGTAGAIQPIDPVGESEKKKRTQGNVGVF